jgi:hypothetical protein
VDGDGDLDALVANAGAGQDVYLNDGAGAFSPHPSAPIFGAGNSAAIALGDIDGDGDLDAIVANVDAAQTVWLNSSHTDLSIGQSYERPFGLGVVTYTVVARNLGSAAAHSAIVNSALSVTVSGVAWTCVAAGGASCTPSGLGNTINDTLASFPSGGVVTYTISGALYPWGGAVNVASITPPAGALDSNQVNNSATLSTTPTINVFLPLILRSGTP